MYITKDNLYDIIVTAEDMINNPSVRSISEGDEFTPSCIRVAQVALDWLVENVEVGTMVVF